MSIKYLLSHIGLLSLVFIGMCLIYVNMQVNLIRGSLVAFGFIFAIYSIGLIGGMKQDE
jgi:hypothetical protein